MYNCSFTVIHFDGTSAVSECLRLVGFASVGKDKSKQIPMEFGVENEILCFFSSIELVFRCLLLVDTGDAFDCRTLF